MKRSVTLTYLKSVLIIAVIIAPFFSLQYLVIVEEFKPQFMLMPSLASLIMGVFLTKVILLRDRIALNNQQLARANNEALYLNRALESENRVMAAELDVTRQLQQMVLPREGELQSIASLDIACFMEPAYEVGGDYYDVVRQADGRVKIGIGDVTGHGLESGMLMLMVQMGVHTLLTNNVHDPVRFMELLNRAVYDNLQRMGSDKNLTLTLLDYQAGLLHLTGQHEEVLVVRKDGRLERIDTIDLGFMVGVKADIGKLLAYQEVRLEPGDGVVLYTDGITEAFDADEDAYGVERLCQVVSRNWHKSAAEVQQAVIDDLRRHIGQLSLDDDATLLVFKQR